MTEINKIENELLKFDKNSDYLVSDKEQDKKCYLIHSKVLKNSLRNIICSTQKWTIKYSLSKNEIEYSIICDNRVGIYRKRIGENLSDEFELLTSQLAQNSDVLREKQEYEQAIREYEQANRVYEQRQRKLDSDLDNGSGNKSYISFTVRKKEDNKWEGEIEEYYTDSAHAQEIREGWGYNFAKQMFSEWAEKRKDKGSQEIVKKVLEDSTDNKETKQEKTDENSSNSNKQNQKTEKENIQQNLSQKIDNKDNNSKNIYYGIGVIGLVLVVVSMVVILVKKKKKLK